LGVFVSRVRIIGIDPGLRKTGWGIIDSEGSRLTYLACGTIRTDAAEDLSDRLMAVYKGLAVPLADWQPHEAAVEQTFVNDNGASTLKLGQARGVAMLVPAMSGLPVAEYTPTLVKKSIVGTGRGDKGQIGAMIAILLPGAKPDSEDAADALAIAITHAHHRTSKQLLARAVA
jgi:crossover junction endodeoxyribonuclease RuvC